MADPLQFPSQCWAGLMASNKWVRVNMSVLIWDKSPDSRPRVPFRREHVGVVDVTSYRPATLHPPTFLKSDN